MREGGQAATGLLRRHTRLPPWPPRRRFPPHPIHTTQCGAANYARLGLLWEAIQPDFRRFAYWFKDNAGTATSQVRRDAWEA